MLHSILYFIFYMYLLFHTLYTHRRCVVNMLYYLNELAYIQIKTK